MKLLCDPSKLPEPSLPVTHTVHVEEKPDWGRIARLREERLRYKAEDVPIRTRSTWSKEADETFRKMYAEGAEFQDIASAIGKNVWTVRRYAAKLVKHGQLKARLKVTTPAGVPLWTPQELFDARKMLEDGMSMAEVAKRLGRTTGAVRKKLYIMRGRK